MTYEPSTWKLPVYELVEHEDGRAGLRFKPALVFDRDHLRRIEDDLLIALQPWWGPICFNADSRRDLHAAVDEALKWFIRERLLTHSDCLGMADTMDLAAINGERWAVSQDQAPEHWTKPWVAGYSHGPQTALETFGIWGWCEYRYGARARRHLQEAMRRAERNTQDTCIDNHRLARVGDAEAELAYEKARETGCCGSFDTLVRYGWRAYRLGFNYGH